MTQNSAIVPQPQPVLDLMHALEEMQGQDIVYLDVHNTSSVSDHIIICSSKSHRHARSLAHEVAYNVVHVEKPVIEGDDFAEWILVDCHHTIVHIMLPQVREYYDLEKLWDSHLNIG